MGMTDPIADMLTRIRNANTAFHEQVDIPASKVKERLAQILKEEGFIKGYQVINAGTQGIIRVEMKYGPNRSKVIVGMKRISKPGLRIYVGKERIPRIFGGLGVVIVSTPKGIMTGRQASEHNVGGEVLAYVW
jgi:small subunit ribosomal protein S8